MAVTQRLDRLQRAERVGGPLEDQRRKHLFAEADLGRDRTAALGHAVNFIGRDIEPGAPGRGSDDPGRKQNPLPADAGQQNIRNHKHTPFVDSS